MSRPIAVDTSALVAILKNEADARQYQRALVEHSGSLLIAAPTWLEALIVVRRHAGEHGVRLLRALKDEVGLRIEDVDAVMSELAFAAHERYGRGRHPARLNFGDCFSYALARAWDLRLLYKGDDFARTDIVGVL